MSQALMPAAFIGHGSPMNTLETNTYTESWRTFGESIPRPTAILCVSAHWYINATAVTSMEKPRTIHDFYGFPKALFDFEYPALGDPVLAAAIGEVVAPRWLGMDHDSWGLDHGTWSVLAHMFPAADIPVLQISIDAQKSFDEHLQFGAALAPLREQGVLIVGSGNIVHNLGILDWSQPDVGFDWAHRFDDAAREILTNDPASAPSMEHHPDVRKAVPTPDHFIPMLYLAGLAAAAGTPTAVLNHGYAMGSLSMTSYVLS